MTEHHISRIAIVGVGLMGGSLGLALKRSLPEIQVVGADSVDILSVALDRGAIDEASESLEDAVRGSDLVFIGTPVPVTLGLLKDIGRFAEPGTWISDMGSVKECVYRQAALDIPDRISFVGGHPMTGSEKASVLHSDELLFENATYVLCPDSQDQIDELRLPDNPLCRVIRSLGSQILFLDATRHDRIAAAISHVPQLLAIALMNHAHDAKSVDAETLQLAAGGFRDMTRIASSSFELWKDVVSLNSEKILDALDNLSLHIHTIADTLRVGDSDSLKSLFESAHETRATIPERSKGFLRALHDVFVFVRDQPGALSEITSLLSNNEVSIKDIELLKIREGTGGTFRLGFNSEIDAEEGIRLLNEAGFKSHRLS